MSGNMMKLCCFEIYLRICGEERLHPQLPPGFLYNCQNQVQVNFSFNAQKKISDQVNLGQIRLEVFKCQTPLGQLYINFKFDQIIYKFLFAQLTAYFVFEYLNYALCFQIFVFVDFNFVFLTLFNIISIFCIFDSYRHGNQVGSHFICLLQYCCLWDWSKSGSHFICSAQFFPLFFIFFFFFV